MLKILDALAALATVGTFVIAFSIRMMSELRSVGVRAVRTVDGICAATGANKNARGGARAFNKS